MDVYGQIKDLRDHLSDKRGLHTIGLVPTMGALHEGHLSLVKEAKAHTDLVVVTIFVNPTQFNKADDLDNYPSDLKTDLNLLREAGTDVVFTPQKEEMYPGESLINISFGSLETALEGKFRPGHFAGVGQIVSKLLNIVQPQLAFFGQKDLQQYAVISRLVSELNFPVRLNMVSTKRENNGLAMSSRNTRLSKYQREEASLLYRSLVAAQQILIKNKQIKEAKEHVAELFEASSGLTLEYFEVVDKHSFRPLSKIEDTEHIALCIAAEIGKVRLIDNMLLNA